MSKIEKGRNIFSMTSLGGTDCQNKNEFQKVAHTLRRNEYIQ